MAEVNEKASLRKCYRALRDAITTEERERRSELIAQQLQSIDRYEHAGSLFIYVATGSEVATLGLIDAALQIDKTILVPRVTAEPGVMQAVKIHSLNDLASGRFGIPEPTTRDDFSETPDLIVVPGLAFTRDGTRLGQGGGYYDRYLASHPAAYKVGICFNEQLADQLPREDHDAMMDEVITA